MYRGRQKTIIGKDATIISKIISSSFDIAAKNVEPENQIFKTRFVDHGRRDEENQDLVHDSITVRQSSILIFVAIEAIIGFDV